MERGTPSRVIMREGWPASRSLLGWFSRAARQPESLEFVSQGGPPTPRLRRAAFALVHERRLVDGRRLGLPTSALRTPPVGNNKPYPYKQLH